MLLVFLMCLAVPRCLGFSLSTSLLTSLLTRHGLPFIIQQQQLHHHDQHDQHHHSSRLQVVMTSSLNVNSIDNTEPGTTAMAATNANQNNDQDSSNNSNHNSLRSTLRRLTGFSLTAFRATMRAATGISLSAVYASALAATSALVRNTMTMVLSPLPPWMRCFVQPLLILYYVPLFVLRSLTGPTGKQARETHELFVQSWQAAVDRADMKVEGYWPTNTSTHDSDGKNFLSFAAATVQ
jgi:hypothetical protein